MRNQGQGQRGHRGSRKWKKSTRKSIQVQEI